MNSAEVTATTVTTRDANAIASNAAPLLLTGTGSFTARTDGVRWWVDESTFSVSQGESWLLPRHVTASYDGLRYASRENDRLVIGECDVASKSLLPNSLFWQVAASSESLERTLSHPSATVTGLETIDGHACVIVRATWTREGSSAPNQRPPIWREHEIAFAFERGWLPVRSTVRMNDRPHSVETLQDLRLLADDIWYAGKIIRETNGPAASIPRQETRIVRLTRREDFANADFQVAPAWQDDVRDLPGDDFYHADPWWPELAVWLRENGGWPGSTLRDIEDLVSHSEGPRGDGGVPPLTPALWLQGSGTPWNATGRRATIVVFFGGECIDPTPRWLTALQRLWREFEPHGVAILGMVPAQSDVEMARRTIRALDLTFPIGIDRGSPRQDSWGASYDDFGLRSYMDAVVVTPDARVRRLESAPLLDVTGLRPHGGQSPLEAVLLRLVGNDAALAIQRQRRQPLLERVSFDLTGHRPDRDLVEPALNSTEPTWLADYARSLHASLDVAQRQWLLDSGSSPETVARETGDSPAHLSSATLQRITRRWRQQRQSLPGQGSLVGETRVATTTRDRFLEADDESSPLKGRRARVRVEPELLVLTSPAAGGHYLARAPSEAVEIESTEEGKYEVTGLRKGRYRVTCSASGLATVERTVVLSDDTARSSLNATFYHNDTIRGTVQSDGRPVSGARVRAILRHFDRRLPHLTTTEHLPGGDELTGVDGSFTLGQLHEGAYTLEVTAPGHAIQRFPAIPAGAREARLRLKRQTEESASAE